MKCYKLIKKNKKIVRDCQASPRGHRGMLPPCTLLFPISLPTERKSIFTHILAQNATEPEGNEFVLAIPTPPNPHPYPRPMVFLSLKDPLGALRES